MRGWAVALAALAAAGLAGALDGSSGFGRLALRLGLPGLAVPLLQDPMWQGVALARIGDFTGAEDAYRRAGPRATFNHANTFARLGDYANAVEGYDAVLHRNPRDWEAIDNRALAASLREAAIEGQILPGTEAAGDGSATGPATTAFEEAVASTANAPKTVEQEQSDRIAREAARIREGVLQRKERVAVPASRRWLATFADEPGRYLAALIAAEHDRRAALGLAQPDPVSPW